MKIYQIVGITDYSYFKDQITVIITDNYEKAKTALDEAHTYSKSKMKNVSIKMYIWENERLIYTVNPDL